MSSAEISADYKDSEWTEVMKNKIEVSTKTVTSNLIAEKFGRRHANVLESLKSLVDSGHLGGLDIKSTSYVDKSNRENKCYELTETGFMIACPFIGGENSRDGQVAIIKEFMRMREDLKPLSHLEVTAQHMQALLNQERRTAAIEFDVKTLQEKVDHTDHIFHLGDYTSIKAYTNVNHIAITGRQASLVGKACASKCRREGIEIKKFPCPVFGEVNGYPVSIIDCVMDGFGLRDHT